MAFAIAPPFAAPTAPALPRPGRLAGLVGSSLALAVCVVGTAAVAVPALASTTTPTVPGHVSVRVLGDISTAGLPAAAAVSTLTVRNDGSAPLQWSARPSVEGTGATGVVVEAWLPTTMGCSSPTSLLDATVWTDAALQPGDTTAVCVRVSTTGTVAGIATPHLTIAARAV
jgi:hypothetical protein